jgi:hypothetical protein
MATFAAKSQLLAAIFQAVPDGATFGFNHDYRRA